LASFAALVYARRVQAFVDFLTTHIPSLPTWDAMPE
jgi:hypothetical protein